MNIVNTIITIVALCALGLAIAALVESLKKKDGYTTSSMAYNMCDCTQCPGGTSNALPGTTCGGTRPCSAAECAIEPVR